MTQYSGKSVLIVEDEALIAMLLEHMLEDSGIATIGPATTLDEALTLARAGGFDAALLDLNLGDALSYPVADVLREAGIPFAFTSGSATIGEAYADAPALTKPFLQTEVEAVLKKLLD